MKTLLLAAGLGTRLRPITKTLPKPLVKIGDKSNLGRNLEQLAKYKTEEVFINLHYLPGEITSFVKDGSKFGLKVTYSLENRLLGTAGAIRKLEKQLRKDSFLVLYADNYAEVSLEKLVRFHKKHRGIATVVLFEDDFDPYSSGIVETGIEGRITKFIEKPRKIFSGWSDAGIYVFEPEMISFIPQNTEFSITRNLFPLLLEKGKRMYGFKIKESVLSLDTIKKFRRSQKIVALQKRG